MSNCDSIFKFCKKCQENTERYARGDCKACVKAQGATYKSANPEKIKLQSAKYRESHSAEINSKKVAWRAANPEKKKADSFAWRIKNREKAKADAVAYRAKNPAKFKIQVATWRAANPGAKRLHANNRRAKKIAAGGKLSAGLGKKLFKLQKGMCPCCKRLLGRDYHLDHIEPLFLGGANTDQNMQLLRKECNLRKGVKTSVNFMQSRGFLL